MKRVVLKHIPLRTVRFAGWDRVCRRVFLTLFLIQFGMVWIGVVLGRPLFGSARWPEGVLLVLCAATTLMSLASQLPVQNVMLATTLITIVTGGVQTLAARTGIPFGPHTYTETIGQELFHPLPWAIPVIWLVALLNARGVARLILRPWRRMRNYGWWLMGLTALLVVLFDFALQPFATQQRHYWWWDVSHAKVNWYGTPWVNFVGRATTTVLILAFVTPSLVQKRPGTPAAPDFHPLMVWLAANLLFATGIAKLELWGAALAISIINLIIVMLAISAQRRDLARPPRQVRCD